MKYRKLGNSELLISEVGFGSWLTFTDPQRKRLAIWYGHFARGLGRRHRLHGLFQRCGEVVAMPVVQVTVVDLQSLQRSIQLLLDMRPRETAVGITHWEEQLDAS